MIFKTNNPTTEEIINFATERLVDLGGKEKPSRLEIRLMETYHQIIESPEDFPKDMFRGLCNKKSVCVKKNKQPSAYTEVFKSLKVIFNRPFKTSEYTFTNKK